MEKYFMFVKSLDELQSSKNTTVHTISNTIKNVNNDKLISKNINVNENNEKNEKRQLDTLLNQIDRTYRLEKLNHENFSGWNIVDVLIHHLEENMNPNIYHIVENPRKSSKTSSKRKPIETETTKTKTNTLPEKIYIDKEINTIHDLIEITDLYPIDDTKEYNINMKALHKIKEPLVQLNSMIGMKTLKQSMLDQIIFYIQNLHNLKIDSCEQDFMHTVIYGPPGTGKTEIAKLIGKVFANIGILDKGTFRKVTRSDLIAGYLGQTAIKTKDAIKDALGGVLFIDEAYSLGNSEKRDSFSKECIDTLCEAASDYKDNLMIIIAGYENELNECFFNYNAGLNSRFTWRYKTDEYTGEDLYNIFLKKVADAEWSVLQDSNINKSWFEKNKDYFIYYGRDMETLFAKTKIAHSRRIFGKSECQRKCITLADLNKGLDMFLSNEEVKNRKTKGDIHKSLTSMYV